MPEGEKQRQNDALSFSESNRTDIMHSTCDGRPSSRAGHDDRGNASPSVTHCRYIKYYLQQLSKAAHLSLYRSELCDFVVRMSKNSHDFKFLRVTTIL